MTDIFTLYEQKIANIVDNLCDNMTLPQDVRGIPFTVEPPREISHGDIATNIAMILAKKMKQSPHVIAKMFVESLKNEKDIISCEVAGAGFINIKLNNNVWHHMLATILQQKHSYGKPEFHNNQEEHSRNKNINIEYVSANPTGPLHVAHARGAVFGDVLASILEFCGYHVTREYYVNDSGSQIDVLVESFFKRYQQQCGIEGIVLEDNLYPGQYLIDLAQQLYQQDQKKWLECEVQTRQDFFRHYVLSHMVQSIQSDLALLNIEHDVFFYESSLLQTSTKTNKKNSLDDVIEQLQKQDMVYKGFLSAPKGEEQKDWKPREQLIFRSTLFGDDSDRPLFKQDGTPTYFANDIAYHYNKYLRGFHQMIDVLGADHAGYIKRIQASVEAITQKNAQLDISVCQLVRLMRNNEPVKMSKRSGEFVTLEQVIREVGADALRFILLLRKNDMPLDFDLELVKKQNSDNPVFYLQYAYARIHSVKRHAQDIFGDDVQSTNRDAMSLLNTITTDEEMALIKKMALWPRIIRLSAQTKQPHRLVFYLYELASEFHKLWNLGKKNEKQRFIDIDNKEYTIAKLMLLEALVIVFNIGMDILKIQKLQNM